MSGVFGDRPSQSKDEAWARFQIVMAEIAGINDQRREARLPMTQAERTAFDAWMRDLDHALRIVVQVVVTRPEREIGKLHQGAHVKAVEEALREARRRYSALRRSLRADRL